MNTQRIPVSANQVNRLIEDIRAVPDSPIGGCLSDEEFIGYAAKSLPPEEVGRLDVHLASCPACTTEMERLLEGAEAWRGVEGEQRLAAFRERVRDAFAAKERGEPAAAAPSPGPVAPEVRERLRGYIGEVIESLRLAFSGREPVWAAASEKESREVWAWRSENRRLQAHAVQEANGDLTFRFWGRDLDLEGQHLALRVGAVQKTLVLHRVSPAEVGAEVVIPRDDLPADLTGIAFEPT